MAKFIYRMQNILDIKYKLEDQAKTQVALARQKLEEEMNVLHELRERKKDYEEQLRGNIVTKLNILTIRELESGIEILKDKISVQKKEVEKARKRYEAAMDNLKNLMIERKTHEKLKENKFEEFVKEINDEENKTTDELVSFKYNN
ncbi:MAG: flagellar export protein FliJ [Lachnospiraceae bacterium]|nr:flagellar export protein FliJ [Lachnospiraceae bacterium]